MSRLVFDALDLKTNRKFLSLADVVQDMIGISVVVTNMELFLPYVFITLSQQIFKKYVKKIKLLSIFGD